MDEAEKPKKKVAKAKAAAPAKPKAKAAAPAKPKAKAAAPAKPKAKKAKAERDATVDQLLKELQQEMRERELNDAAYPEVAERINAWVQVRLKGFKGHRAECLKQLEKMDQAAARNDYDAAFKCLDKAMEADPSALRPVLQFLRVECSMDPEVRLEFLETIKSQFDEELGFDPELPISPEQRDELLMVVTESVEVLFELERFAEVHPLVMMALQRLSLDESASGLIVLAIFAAALSGDFDMLAMLLGDELEGLPAQLMPLALVLQIRNKDEAAAQKTLAKLRQEAPVIIDFLSGKIDAEKCSDELQDQGLVAESIAIPQFIAPFWSQHPEGRAWLLRNSFLRR
ncbi:MAG: hypothetical protein RL095_3737 [Verrucomicrobiota bacterium]|jgi:hypothetical protein